MITIEINTTSEITIKINGKEVSLKEETISQPECVVCSDGSKYWFLNGKLHRVDGPAVEYVDGFKSWYLNGKQVSPEEMMKNLTPEQKLLINYLKNQKS